MLCNDLVSPASAAAGKLSHLAKCDSGLRLDSVPNNYYWLSSGSHTLAVRKSSPSQQLLGWTSSTIGWIQFNLVTHTPNIPPHCDTFIKLFYLHLMVYPFFFTHSRPRHLR